MRPPSNIASAAAPPGSTALQRPTGSHVEAMSYIDESVRKYFVNDATVTDKYRLEHELGKGRYATVRKCRCNITDNEFALKVMRKARVGLSRAAILNEIQTLERCSDFPFVTKLIEVFENQREINLVLEYAPCGELYGCLVEHGHGAGLPEDFCRRVLVQLCTTLTFLHNNSIIHCDVNPHNILLMRPFPDCEIRLCDFGLSRVMTAGVSIKDIKGTLEYVAPEVLLFDPIGPYSDMWSVGVLAYVILSGLSPFAGDTKQQTLFNVSTAAGSSRSSEGDDDADLHEFLFSAIEGAGDGEADWFSHEARDFISRLLIRNTRRRLSAESCLSTPWLSTAPSGDSESSLSDSPVPPSRPGLPPSPPTSTSPSASPVSSGIDDSMS